MHTWINCFFLLDYLGQSSLFASCSRKRGQAAISGSFKLRELRSGIRGMEVRLGQFQICNFEREGGNDGSKRWCGSSSSSSSSEFLHHPFSFGQSIIDREDKDGKKGVFEEEEEEEEAPNTLLTLSSSEMYSSGFIPERERDLRKGSWFNGGRCCNLLFQCNSKGTRLVREETQLGILTPI